KARAEAMARANTNQPLGRGYNAAMSDLLKEYGLDDMSETARGHILKIMENLADVEEWRAKQKDPADLNHPSRVWTKYQRSSKQQDRRDAARKPSRAEQTSGELAAALQTIEEQKAHIAELEAAREATPAKSASLTIKQHCDALIELLVKEDRATVRKHIR